MERGRGGRAGAVLLLFLPAGADARCVQALSELFRAITALPADVTLLSLPAQPLLGVVCRAAGRRLTAVWLALATILIAQLNPPPMILTLRSAPSPEAEAGVRSAVGEIVGSALNVLGAPGGMVEVRFSRFAVGKQE